MERRYRLQKNDTPQSLAVAGKGHPEELYAVNKTWISSDFMPWNPGQQMVIPAAWSPIAGEFPS
jgi:hypothetical protein